MRETEEGGEAYGGGGGVAGRGWEEIGGLKTRVALRSPR